MRQNVRNSNFGWRNSKSRPAVLTLAWAFALLTVAYTGTSSSIQHIQAFSFSSLPSPIKWNRLQSESHANGGSRLQGTLSAKRNSADGDRPVGPEKSQMPDFISRYLAKNRNSDGNNDGTDSQNAEKQSIPEPLDPVQIMEQATHLIAIPMDTCHELMIELESVQRAILYHCPILTDACIVPAMSRLPLLYVQAGTPGSPSSSMVAMSQITRIVNDVIEKQFFSNDDAKAPLEADANKADNDDDDDDDDDNTSNSEGDQPLLMTFGTLEIDGDCNEILNTVGDPNDDGTLRLQRLVSEMYHALRVEGYLVATPFDSNSGAKAIAIDNTSGDTNAVDSYRPRLPFMQLPREFNDNLKKFRTQSVEITEKDMEFLSSENGGNGISPIFWANWWDDVFGRSVRLQEVGIYSRTASSNEKFCIKDHDVFTLPNETILLPDTDDSALKQREAKFEKYQESRLEEERQRQENDLAKLDAKTNPTTDPSGKANLNDFESNSQTPDILMTKTRERLEALYQQSEPDLATIENETVGIENNSQKSGQDDAKIDDEDDDEVIPKPSRPKASDDDYIEDWAQQRIRNIIESRDLARTRQQEVKKNKPPIEDNPVFKKYKEGTLVPKSQMYAESTKKTKELPPYPSREHFVGFWQILSSPTGFEADALASDKSENLILRIDGTTAGGPILDQENQQKAAGGTWKLFTDEDNQNPRLRIRLVIPPKKERILVMEGPVSRIDPSGGSSAGIPMATKTFGIPAVEARYKSINKDGEDIINCDGPVYMEDAITGKNKQEIGEFSIVKLMSPRQDGDYIVTIPKPVRTQD